MSAKYINGIPANLEASANDALTWLEFFADKAKRGQCQMSDENWIKLGQAIELLRQFLPIDEPEFSETTEEPT